MREFTVSMGEIDRLSVRNHGKNAYKPIKPK